MPPIPPGLDWVGEPVESIDRLVAAQPVLVHFFDFAQLNSVRTAALPAGLGRALPAGRARRCSGSTPPAFPSPRTRPLWRPRPIVSASTGRWRWTPSSPSGGIYEPHGWPALFLWGQGGALRWYHLGEGDYAGTEEAIREALSEADGDHDWPPLLEPIRPSDVPGVKVIAPTPELFPGGSTEEPWSSTEGDGTLELDYEAGGAYAATDGEGSIALRVDGDVRAPIEVTNPGLQELITHEARSVTRSICSPPPACSSIRSSSPRGCRG